MVRREALEISQTHLVMFRIDDLRGCRAIEDVDESIGSLVNCGSERTLPTAKPWLPIAFQPTATLDPRSYSLCCRSEGEFGHAHCMSSDIVVPCDVLMFKVVTRVDYKVLDDVWNLKADLLETGGFYWVPCTSERNQMVVMNENDPARSCALRVHDCVAQAAPYDPRVVSRERRGWLRPGAANVITSRFVL